MGPFLLENNPFKDVKGLLDYVEDREFGARASPSESSNTLLVVSTLDTLRLSFAAFLSVFLCENKFYQSI